MGLLHLRRYATQSLLLLSMTSFLTSCGDTKFAGIKEGSSSTSNDQKDDVNQSTDAVLGASTNLNWFWQCEQDPINTDTLGVEKNSLLVGTGPHTLQSSKQAQVKLNISGQLCPTQNMDRDIVVVVDISSSNADDLFSRGNDPKSKDCGRKTAVAALIKNLKLNPTARVGIVTFESNVNVNSQILLTASEFESAYVTDEILCEAKGGTDYVNALLAAQNVLATGRESATKEMYFITDGEPDSESEAKDAADTVKESTTIATIMLGNSNDNFLKNDIASKNEKGEPLHAISTKATDLEATLAKLTQNDLSSGVYRFTQQDGTMKELDLWKAKNGYRFIIPELKINAADYPQGFQFEYEYLDKKNKNFKYQGELIWE